MFAPVRFSLVIYLLSLQSRVVEVEEVMKMEDGEKVVEAEKVTEEEVCTPATAEISPARHTYAVEGLEVSRISFSSCHLPELMERDAPTFWQDVRHVSQPELWLWMGDNIYWDGNDINAKRLEYNKVREEESYTRHGLVSETEPVIPIMACWDDHDYGYENAGSDYPCSAQSQAEWAHHVNIPPTEPQHPDSPDYRPGVYNSRIFLKPGTEETGTLRVRVSPSDWECEPRT